MLDPARHQRVKELFLETCEREPDVRSSFLDAACGDDAALRAEVEALLTSERERPEFLESSPAKRAELRDSEAMPAIPERIGAFRIVRLIASGGMGHVFEAEQEDPRRRVALKVMRFSLSSAESRRRFEIEKSVLARLQHPGISQIFEAGTGEVHGLTLPYFAMELVPGVEVMSYVRSNELASRARLELFVRIGDAVAHAHQHGIIHRDLKPANILVTADGQPKVLDFGIARAVGSEVQQSTFGTAIAQIVGTLPYMSPEQTTATPDQIDARCDVYGLGLVLYELLTDRLPYEVANLPLPEAVRVICEQAPQPISAIRRGLHPELQTIVGKALEKTPAGRYSSVEALVEDVRRHLRGEPIEARATSRFRRLGRSVSRNRSLAAATGVLVVASLLGGSWWIHMAKRSAEAQRSAYRANLAAVSAALPFDSRSSTDDAREGLHNAPEALRNWEWRYLHSRFEQSVDETLQESILVLDHTNSVYAVTISPNGRQIASAGWDSDARARLWDAASSLRVDADMLDCGSGYLRHLAFDPRGKHLVAVGERSVRVFDTATLEQSQLLGDGGAYAAAFRPDGSLLVLGHGAQIETLVGEPLVQRAFAPGPAGVIAFAPDGRRFASATGDARGDPNHIVVWDPDTLEHEIDVHTQSHAIALNYSPDGTSFAVGEGDGRVSVWDARGGRGEPLRSWQAHVGKVFAVVYLNAERIATGGNDGEIGIWEATTGHRLATLRGHTDYVHSLATSEDGERLVSGSGDGTVRIWETVPLARRIEAAKAAGVPGSAFAPRRQPDDAALGLDGSSAIQIEMPDALEDLTEFTLECWVRGPRPTRTAGLISNAEGEGFALLALPGSSSPPGPFLKSIAYSNVPNEVPVAKVDGLWPSQTWTHVAVCFDGSELCLFVGGIRRGSSPLEVPGRPDPGVKPLFIGADAGPTEPELFFTGAIDEVRVSRVVRYRERFTPSTVFEPDPDTLLLLHFDREVRGRHPDASGHQRHGRGVGSPQLVTEPR